MFPGDGLTGRRGAAAVSFAALMLLTWAGIAADQAHPAAPSRCIGSRALLFGTGCGSPVP